MKALPETSRAILAERDPSTLTVILGESNCLRARPLLTAAWPSLAFARSPGQDSEAGNADQEW
jgi:hypothetical protein